MSATLQTVAEYAGKYPNLHHEMTGKGITHVVTIKSNRAIAQGVIFKNGVTLLWYGSQALLDRYLAQA